MGDWFGPAIGPLSEGVTSFMERRMKGRKLYIAIDWPILASRAELWAVANILAPILLLIAMILPGNSVLPLGGIILTVLAPSLLIGTRGKVVRMTLIGTIMIPLFLWAATLISPFLTQTSKAMGVFPSGLGRNEMFSAVDSDPLEKMLAMLIGNAAKTLDLKTIGLAVLAVAAYIALFAWYHRQLGREAVLAEQGSIRSGIAGVGEQSESQTIAAGLGEDETTHTQLAEQAEDTREVTLGGDVPDC